MDPLPFITVSGSRAYGVQDKRLAQPRSKPHCKKEGDPEWAVKYGGFRRVEAVFTIPGIGRPGPKSGAAFQIISIF